MAQKRKTYTSTAVKAKWNKAHYDSIIIQVPIGSKSEVRKLAEEMGITLSEYVRQAIRLKVEQDGKGDETPVLLGNNK